MNFNVKNFVVLVACLVPCLLSASAAPKLTPTKPAGKKPPFARRKLEAPLTKATLDDYDVMKIVCDYVPKTDFAGVKFSNEAAANVLITIIEGLENDIIELNDVELLAKKVHDYNLSKEDTLKKLKQTLKKWENDLNKQ